MQPAVPFTEGDFDDSIKKKKKKDFPTSLTMYC